MADSSALRPGAGGCVRCRAPIGPRLSFRLPASGEQAPACLRCALAHWPTIRRSLRIAAVVGSVLVLINQGDVLWGGVWSPALTWKIPLTYLVPFVVATWGALLASRH